MAHLLLENAGKKLTKARRRENARFFPADTRSIVANSAMKPLSIAAW
jgi:hypothetical protein